MSLLAYKLLAIFIDHTYKLHCNYIPTWTLRELVGCEQTIEAARVKCGPETPEEWALRELVNIGLVREKPNLGERFELIIIDR